MKSWVWHSVGYKHIASWWLYTLLVTSTSQVLPTLKGRRSYKVLDPRRQGWGVRILDLLYKQRNCMKDRSYLNDFMWVVYFYSFFFFFSEKIVFLFWKSTVPFSWLLYKWFIQELFVKWFWLEPRFIDLNRFSDGRVWRKCRLQRKTHYWHVLSHCKRPGDLAKSPYWFCRSFQVKNFLIVNIRNNKYNSNRYSTKGNLAFVLNILSSCIILFNHHNFVRCVHE